MVALLLILLCLSAACGGLAPGRRVPASPTDAPALTGWVVDGTTGQPVEGASVTLSFENGRSRSLAGWKRRGEFVFSDVREGTYALLAEKEGYSPAPDDPPLVLTIVPGTHLAGLSLRLWRDAIVTGRVLDEAGRPFAWVRVQAVRRTYVAGRPRFVPAPNASVRADDHGVYRLALPARGRYLVTARESLAADPFFHPSSYEAASASVLVPDPGEELRGIDIRRPDAAEMGGVAVSGRVVVPEGRWSSKEVTLARVGPGVGASVAPLIRIADDDGRFTFGGVLPGRYSISFVDVPHDWIPAPGTVVVMQWGDGRTSGPSWGVPIAPAPAAPTLWGEVSLAVAGRDISDVVVRARTAGRMSGRVVFEGTTAKMPEHRLERIPLILFAADGRDLGEIPVTRIEGDGHFTTPGIPPGRYLLSPQSLPSPWRVREVRQRNTRLPNDVISLDQSGASDLLIVVTDRLPRVSGVVVGSKGRPAGLAAICIFPVDRDLWVDYGPSPRRLRMIRADPLGRYQVELPPGSYFFTARESDVEDWPARDTLEMLARSAVKVRLSDRAEVSKRLRAR